MDDLDSPSFNRFEKQQTLMIHLLMLAGRYPCLCEGPMIGFLDGAWGGCEENSFSVRKEKGYVREVG
jgi:hypothetical protein